MHEIIHILEHVFFDTLKIIPFLFVAFLFLELIEHKASKKMQENLIKSQKYGPIVGGIMGAVPQCGFSVMATNFFSNRIITLGTLIAVYLSTSDEMLPILLSSGENISLILAIIGSKVAIGVLFGVIIDFVLKKNTKAKEVNFNICEKDKCNCHNNLFLGAIKHTIKIFVFVYIISFIFDFVIHFYGEEAITNLFLNGNIFASFMTALIGLIPNCAASVIITETYLNGAITLGALIGGLLTGAGSGLIVLFKTNRNLRENIMIIGIIYIIGSVVGLAIDLLISLF